jgi:hypothetical protein
MLVISVGSIFLLTCLTTSLLIHPHSHLLAHLASMEFLDLFSTFLVFLGCHAYPITLPVLGNFLTIKAES